jgi:hypothetical protein
LDSLKQNKSPIFSTNNSICVIFPESRRLNMDHLLVTFSFFICISLISHKTNKKKFKKWWKWILFLRLCIKINIIESRVNQIICRTPTERREKLQLIGSSSPYESNWASPTGGRRPLPFKRDLMGLSLSLSLKLKPGKFNWRAKCSFQK